MFAMRMITYLNYGGNCEQAFRFYEQHLGGKITALVRHGEQPNAQNVPSGWERSYEHRRDRTDGSRYPAGPFLAMRSAYLTLLVESDQDAERIYALFSDGGQVFMPMEDTFFASRFAMLRDRFGTSWMILHERST